MRIISGARNVHIFTIAYYNNVEKSLSKDNHECKDMYAMMSARGNFFGKNEYV